MDASQVDVKGDIRFGRTTEPIEFWQMHARPFGTADASVAMYRGERGIEDPSSTAECREDFMIVHHLRPFVSHEEWRNDRAFRVDEMPQGSFVFYDMRDQWRSHVRDAFHTVNIFLPQAAFARFGGRQKSRTRDALKWEPGAFSSDPTLHHLVMALMSSETMNATKDTLFADHILEAMIAHIAQRYGNLNDIFAPRAKLAPWQERRAKALMMSRLAHEISIAELAEACGVPDDHFSRMFRMSTGSTPHEWFRGQRLELAKGYLQNSQMNMAEISFLCGFSHQAHFSRVFARHMGLSPEAWRRVSRN